MHSFTCNIPRAQIFGLGQIFNRLVPPSDTVPKLQFVFLRNEGMALQVSTASLKSLNYSIAEHWLRERPCVRDNDMCLGKEKRVLFILAK